MHWPTIHAGPEEPGETLQLVGQERQRLAAVRRGGAGLKIVTAVADGASVASVHPDRLAPTFGDIGKSTHRPAAQLIGTNLAALEESLLTRRFPRAIHYARLNGLNTIQGAGTGARIGIIASGKTYLDLREALTRLGVADLSKLGVNTPKRRDSPATSGIRRVDNTRTRPISILNSL